MDVALIGHRSLWQPSQLVLWLDGPHAPRPLVRGDGRFGQAGGGGAATEETGAERPVKESIEIFQNISAFYSVQSP